MAHFAKVLDGRVIQVIVAEPDFFDTFVDSSPGEWIQTSYNTRGGIHYKPNSQEPSEDQSKALRGNYAGVNYLYDRVNDVFYESQPYPSWTLNRTTWRWESPVPYPTNTDKIHLWDESSRSWFEAKFL